MDSLRLVYTTLTLVAALALGSCTGSEDAPCQLDGDCNSGLQCCKPTASISARGICQAVCMTFARDAGTPVDAGPLPDGGSVDGGGDAGDSDGGGEDGGSDAGGSDAGPADAGTAGTDAGTDAG